MLHPACPQKEVAKCLSGSEAEIIMPSSFDPPCSCFRAPFPQIPLCADSFSSFQPNRKSRLPPRRTFFSYRGRNQNVHFFPLPSCFVSLLSCFLIRLRPEASGSKSSGPRILSRNSRFRSGDLGLQIFSPKSRCPLSLARLSPSPSSLPV